MGRKGYYLFDLDTERSLISRDAKFFDTNFPYLSNSDNSSSIPLSSVAPNMTDSSYSECFLDELSPSFSLAYLPTEPPTLLADNITSYSALNSAHSPQSSASEYFPTIPTAPQEFRKEPRHKNKPAWLKDLCLNVLLTSYQCLQLRMSARLPQVHNILFLLIHIPIPLFLIMHIMSFLGMYQVFRSQQLMIRLVHRKNGLKL